MFGLFLTLYGSVLLAIMVLGRTHKQIYEQTSSKVSVNGTVNPGVMSLLKETYYFRTGIVFVALGTFLQLFPEFDVKVTDTSILTRLMVFIIGLIILLLVSIVTIKKIADNKYKNFKKFEPPFS